MDSHMPADPSLWLSTSVKLVTVGAAVLALLLWVADLRDQVKTNARALQELQEAAVTSELKLLGLRVATIERDIRSAADREDRASLEATLRRALRNVTPPGMPPLTVPLRP